MNLRVLKMINNFPDGYEAVKDSKMIGEFSAWGYFDALDRWVQSDPVCGSNWESLNRAVLSDLTGAGKVTSISVLMEGVSESKEETFWNDVSNPLLAISLVRTVPGISVREFIRKENQENDRIAYYSYDHCEMVVVFRSCSYEETLQKIRKLYSNGEAMKVYTILAASESFLNDPNQLCNLKEDELVCVRMTATMRDRNRMEAFCEELERRLYGEVSNPPRIRRYDLLGNDDVLIEFDDAPFQKLLPLYAAGELLTHGNEEYYRHAFFNVESRLLIPGGTKCFCDAQTGSSRGSNAVVSSMGAEGSWILKDIGEIKSMCEQEPYCKEEALVSYMVCMVRLLNGMVQIATSDFHRYERKILLKPMEIFTKYFMEMVKIASEMDAKFAQEKDELIDSIELAVCQVSDIYENVLNGTAKTDKQMFLSFPLNSSVYEISPKLYAYYAELIGDLQAMFDPGYQYAFFLNPTLKRTLQERVLFEKREEKGKVVVIDIPVRMLDDVQYLPLYMIHEIFHVLTAKQRNRKFRAGKFMACLIVQLNERIFDGVCFLENVDADKHLRELLFEQWFSSTMTIFMHQCKSAEEDDKGFYGKMVITQLQKLVETDLAGIDDYSWRDFIMCLQNEPEYSDIRIRDFVAFESNGNRLLDQLDKIKRNARNLLYTGGVLAILKNLMFLFKETYADLLMLLVTKCPYTRYEEAFARSVQFKMKTGEFGPDMFKVLRQALVKAAFDNDRRDLIVNDTLISLGKNEYNSMVSRLKHEYSVTNAPLGTEKAGQVDNDGIIIGETCFICILEYLFQCKNEVCQTLHNLPENGRRWDSLKKKMYAQSQSVITDCIEHIDFGI